MSIKQISKLQHILHRKVRQGWKSQFVISINVNNEALAIVGSGSTSVGSAWVEAVPKLVAFTMSSLEFRTDVRIKLLLPYSRIILYSLCSCKDRLTVDVRGIHLQTCERLHGETIKTHDILNEGRIKCYKSIDLLAYKINGDHFRVAVPTCWLRGDQLVHKVCQLPLAIDVTLSNIVIRDIKDKEGNLQLLWKRRVGG